MSAEAWAGLSFGVSLVAVGISIKAYFLAKSVTALDLRIKLAAAFADLDIFRRELAGSMEHGNRSRERVINLRNPGGAAVAWQGEYQRDVALLNSVLNRSPVDKGSHEKLSISELEGLLVTIAKSLTELRRLELKYAGVLEQDDAFRNARVPRVGH